MPVLFFVFWILLNARVTLEVVILGIAISAIISYFTYGVMGLRFAAERKAWGKALQITGYLFLLVWEVVKANIHMIRLILSEKIEIKPQIIYFKSPVSSTPAKVALANSITLTPGTITIELDGDLFGVHTIDAPMGEGVEDSVFVHKLKRIEGGHGNES